MEYKQSRIIIGQKGEEPCTPKHNSGFFSVVQQKRDIHAMFTGHDHWNDYISELDEVWLGYGRVTGSTGKLENSIDSSCTEPSIYSDYSNAKRCPERGGRVVRYDSSTKELSTWIETIKGPE